MKIVIALNTVVNHDAIGNHVVFMYNLLKSRGYTCFVYCIETNTEIKPIPRQDFLGLISDSSNLLIYHHSIFWEEALWFLTVARCKKIIKYHNITPEKFFFGYNDIFYDYCKRGREETRIISRKVPEALWISDSFYNSLDVDADHNTVCPPFNNIEHYDSVELDQEIFKTIRNNKAINLLFVGRFAPNKGHRLLVEILKAYTETYDSDIVLHILGKVDPGTTKYYDEITDLINGYKLMGNVNIVGEVNDSILLSYFKGCDYFLCTSEHEGFCVPLIEAQYLGLPVIAKDSSAVGETLGSDQIILGDDPFEYAAAINILSKNPKYREFIIEKGFLNYKKRFKNSLISEHLLKILSCWAEGTFPAEYSAQPNYSIQYRFEGPFDSSYSLAIVNRETALAMNKKHPGKVALLSTDGPGDYEPSAAVFKENKALETLCRLSKSDEKPLVAARNLYPPRVSGMGGKIKILNSYGWEESEFIKEFVVEFNETLSGITVMSHYVKDVLRNNGVALPIKVAGLGADHVLRYSPCPLPEISKKKFKFLHISSCFPRKGVDVLLKAFYSAFSGEDDVSLIIKTFPNPHNKVTTLIDELERTSKNPPEVILIEEDWSDEKMAALYKTADFLVAPSRGEGFGLPMAEAMPLEVPVITTGYGGQTDFCNDETSWLIDHAFTLADTHMKLINSFWAEPDGNHLTRLMLDAVHLPKELVDRKVRKAKKLIASSYTWEKTVERIDGFVGCLQKKADKKKVLKEKYSDINVDWVRSWSSKCGMARYSEMILKRLRSYLYTPYVYEKTTDNVVYPELEHTVLKEKHGNIKVGWVSSWNTKCGIVRYSEMLLNHLRNHFDTLYVYANRAETVVDPELEKNVFRCWDCQKPDLDKLRNLIQKHNPDMVVIQFNFGFFRLQALAELINHLKSNDIKVIMVLHSVKDVNRPGAKLSLGSIIDALQCVDRIFVHNIDELNYLKGFGLTKNTAFFPHGVELYDSQKTDIDKKRKTLKLKGKKIISSYGFMLPHKGIYELIESFSLLSSSLGDKVHLLLVNAFYDIKESREYYLKCKGLVAKLKLDESVTFITDYLDDEESMSYLKLSDIIVFPYQNTQESSSAAVRFGLASGVPVACTPLGIFNDVQPCVHFFKGVNPAAIAEGLENILKTKGLKSKKSDMQEKWVNEMRWDRVSYRLANLIYGIVDDGA